MIGKCFGTVLVGNVALAQHVVATNALQFMVQFVQPALSTATPHNRVPQFGKFKSQSTTKACCDASDKNCVGPLDGGSGLGQEKMGDQTVHSSGACCGWRRCHDGGCCGWRSGQEGGGKGKWEVME